MKELHDSIGPQKRARKAEHENWKQIITLRSPKMRIVLRETQIPQGDGTVIKRITAHHTDDGSPMRQIPSISSPIWCNNDNLSTEHDHFGGIFWDSWEGALSQLSEHEIYLDDNTKDTNLNSPPPTYEHFLNLVKSKIDYAQRNECDPSGETKEPTP